MGLKAALNHVSAAFAIALCCAGCASSGAGSDGPLPQQPANRGAWIVGQTKDRLTDHVTKSAVLVAARASVSTGPWLTQTALLSVSCLNGHMIPLFQFGWPAGHTATALSYRFDAAPAQSAATRFMGAEDAFAIEGQAAKKFIAQLRGASSLYVQINSAAGSQATADFNVTGAEGPVETIRTECPESMAPRRPVSNRPSKNRAAPTP